jgi:hypothetical protein
MHPLRVLLDNAAHGSFPPCDGVVEVLPSPGGYADAVIGFTGHFVLAADVDPASVVTKVAPADFSLPMAPGTLADLGRRLGSAPRAYDALFCRIGEGTGAPAWLHEVDAHDHPRVDRAARIRTDLRLWIADDVAAVLILGRGVCGRWELGFEVAPHAQGRGLGRAVAAAGAAIAPAGEPLWAQVAPGNAASMRAVAAAGYTVVGSEVLFLRADQ